MHAKTFDRLLLLCDHRKSQGIELPVDFIPLRPVGIANNASNAREHHENDASDSYRILRVRGAHIQSLEGGVLKRLDFGIDIDIHGIYVGCQGVHAGT